MNEPAAKTEAKTATPADDDVVLHATASPPYKVKDGVIEAGGEDGGEAAARAPARHPPDPASWMHQRLVHQILEFEKNLSKDHELGGRFVGGPSNEPLHITNVASWGPDMIVFMGQLPDGKKFELLQHYSQVSVLLVAVPKMKDEPRRIGFELLKHVRDLPLPWGDPIS